MDEPNRKVDSMTINLASAQANLAAWTAASLALAEGQSYTLNGRSLSMANAAEVREMLNYWSGVEARLLNAAATGKNRRVGVALARFP